MKSKMMWCFCLAGLLGLNCGGAPVEAPEVDEHAGMIKSIVSTRQPDGTYHQRAIYQTKAEYDAEVAARDELIRARKEGKELAFAPSEIGAGTCASNYSLWLYSQTGASGGTRCCVEGTGEAPLWTMCPFTTAYSLKTGYYTAWYLDDDATCGDTVDPVTTVLNTFCDATWAGQN